MPGLSAAELSFLEGGIAQDLRNDGRGREDFRSFSIQLDVISQVIGIVRRMRLESFMALYKTI
jgi:exosome complex RNA-binding protein Rrp42 (RNase PH superfamily)